MKEGYVSARQYARDHGLNYQRFLMDLSAGPYPGAYRVWKRWQVPVVPWGLQRLTMLPYPHFEAALLSWLAERVGRPYEEVREAFHREQGAAIARSMLSETRPGRNGWTG